MALNSGALKNAIKDALEGIDTTANDALSALGDALAGYIMEYATVDFSWNGIQPGTPPVIDTVTSASGEIIGLEFDLTPSSADNQPAAIEFLKTQLIAGLSAAQYNITETGFSTTPQLMSTSPVISNLDISIDVEYNDDSKIMREQGLQHLADCITDWVTSQVPAGIILGSHGSYTAPTGTGGVVTGIS